MLLIVTKKHLQKGETNLSPRLNLPKENHVPWNRNLTPFLRRGTVQGYKRRIQSSNKQKKMWTVKVKKICLIQSYLICN